MFVRTVVRSFVYIGWVVVAVLLVTFFTVLVSLCAHFWLESLHLGNVRHIVIYTFRSWWRYTVNIDVHIIHTVCVCVLFLLASFFSAADRETKHLNANEIFFHLKRCSCMHRVNMWTSGHMISMKNCKAVSTADKKYVQKQQWWNWWWWWRWR